MKLRSSFLTICLLATTPILAQQDCRVELPAEAKEAKLVRPYAGECKDGLAHGKGSYSYQHEEPGFLFGSKTVVVEVTGDFNKGVIHGKAVSTDSLGSRYVGEVENNRPNGRGRFDFGKDAPGTMRFVEGLFRDGKFWEGHGMATVLSTNVDWVFKEGKGVTCSNVNPNSLCLELLPKENLERRAREKAEREQVASSRQEAHAQAQSSRSTVGAQYAQVDSRGGGRPSAELTGNPNIAELLYKDKVSVIRDFSNWREISIVVREISMREGNVLLTDVQVPTSLPRADGKGRGSTWDQFKAASENNVFNRSARVTCIVKGDQFSKMGDVRERTLIKVQAKLNSVQDQMVLFDCKQ